MFVLIRTMKFEKGFENTFKERFDKPSPITESPGFVKREILVSTKNKDFDLVKMIIFFEDKKAYYVWQGSPAHIAMHKAKKEGNYVKPEGLIEVTKDEFTTL